MNVKLAPAVAGLVAAIAVTTLLGLIWGMLRGLSGSVLVPSVSHAVWNGIDYPLFGFGEKSGALGIGETHIFGPEVGWLGVILNLCAAAALYALFRRKASQGQMFS